MKLALRDDLKHKTKEIIRQAKGLIKNNRVLGTDFTGLTGDSCSYAICDKKVVKNEEFKGVYCDGKPCGVCRKRFLIDLISQNKVLKKTNIK